MGIRSEILEPSIRTIGLIYKLGISYSPEDSNADGSGRGLYHVEYTEGIGTLRIGLHHVQNDW